MQGLCTSGHPAVLGCQRRAHFATFCSKKDKLTHRCSYAANPDIEIKRKSQRSCVRCGAAGSNKPSLDQSPNLQEGIQEQKSETKWATATVTQNRYSQFLSHTRMVVTSELWLDMLCRNVSADGCLRSLTLSIEDPVRCIIQAQHSNLSSIPQNQGLQPALSSKIE